MSKKRWQPLATRQILQRRAMLLQDIRDFFQQREVLEVETPILSPYANVDPAIESFSVREQGKDYYLHTSPEFAMKRLLAAGSGAIFQIAKVFRQEELGRWHHPEFTLLEWYRPQWTLSALMEEVLALIQSLDNQFKQLSVQYDTYQKIFQRYTGIDPLNTTVSVLRQYSQNAGFAVEGLGEDKDAWLDLLMVHVIEPKMASGITFISEYPTTQAALARINSCNPQVADRFEMYIKGVEIANGFYELKDAKEQELRFMQDNRYRKQHQQAVLPYDRKLLMALEDGLPDCSGVAVGVDRLLMLATGATHIEQVLSFGLEKS